MYGSGGTAARLGGLFREAPAAAIGSADRPEQPGGRLAGCADQ
jgi:hypothetical protein